MAGLVRMHRNERLAPLPQWFVEDLAASINSSLLTGYPVTDGLYRQLGSYLGLPEERILLTAGSDAAIKAVYHSYVRPGDTVVTLDPTYAMYEVYARMFGARPRLIPFDAELQLDAEELLESVDQRVRLVMIANPNQPTGTLLDQKVLLKLIQRATDVGALLALDEAYYPFSRASALPWINDFSNLLVIRTFSKAAGLAGLRIGFVAGHPKVIGNLFKVRSIHDINSIALLAAAKLLEHPEIVEDYTLLVQAGARLLTERLEAMGLELLPTYTNFVQIRVGHRCPPDELVVRLAKQGYLVRGPSDLPGLAGCIRVTLGPPDLMEAFADVLQRIIEQASAEPKGAGQ